MKMFAVVATLANGETLSTVVNARNAADVRSMVINADPARLVARLSIARVY
jgi:hypothetical protein